MTEAVATADSHVRRPDLIALAFVRDADRTLLVRHAYGLHLWGLPGGAVEVGESPREAAIREVREETGLTIILDGLVGVADRIDRLLLIYAARVTGGSATAQVEEIEEIRWFSPNDLAAITPAAFALAIELAQSASIGRPTGLMDELRVTGPDGSHGLHLVR